jgi:hypothetical protein
MDANEEFEVTSIHSYDVTRELVVNTLLWAFWNYEVQPDGSLIGSKVAHASRSESYMYAAAGLLQTAIKMHNQRQNRESGSEISSLQMKAMKYRSQYVYKVHIAFLRSEPVGVHVRWSASSNDPTRGKVPSDDRLHHPVHLLRSKLQEKLSTGTYHDADLISLTGGTLSDASEDQRLISVTWRIQTHANVGKLKIFVDDSECARISNGRRVTFVVDPGIYEVSIGWLFFRSKPVTVEMVSHRKIALICGEYDSGEPGFKGIFSNNSFVEIDTKE